MNTQSHVIMGAVLFGKPLPRIAWVAAAGGLIPDLPMYVIIGALRMQGYSLDLIFGELYWQDWWQVANAIGHNFLLWGSLTTLAGALLLRSGAGSFRRAFSQGGTWAMAFAFSASALISSATDFLLHHNDGHMHFWPLSTWRFTSPVSYWDPAHYGNFFGIFEAMLGLAFAVILFRRYTNIGIRFVLVLVVLAYIAIPLFYFWSLSGHDHHKGALLNPPSLGAWQEAQG